MGAVYTVKLWAQIPGNKTIRLGEYDTDDADLAIREAWKRLRAATVGCGKLPSTKTRDHLMDPTDGSWRKFRRERKK